MNKEICVTLAVGEHDHTWGLEDVFLTTDPESEFDNEASYEDRARVQWGLVNAHRSVAFLTLYQIELPGDDDPLNIYPGDVAARDSY